MEYNRKVCYLVKKILDLTYDQSGSPFNERLANDFQLSIDFLPRISTVLSNVRRRSVKKILENSVVGVKRQNLVRRLRKQVVGSRLQSAEVQTLFENRKLNLKSFYENLFL